MPRLRFGVELPQHMGFPHLKEMAQTAEALGYDSIWVKDHLIISPEEMTRPPQSYMQNGQRKVSGSYLSCLPSLAALASVTNRVMLGTDILNIPRRNPVDIANEVATIDQISGGRFILHGAIGQPTRDWLPIGLNPPLNERGRMMEEGLEIIEALWTHEEPVSYKGKYYTLENARIGNRPVQKPHPPIWLGVEKTFKRVAKYASGFTLTTTMYGGALEDYKSALQKIHDEARKIGRDPQEIEAAARFALVIGEDDSAAKRRSREHWGKIRGREERWHTERAGDPETIAKVIRPFIEAGATHIMLYPLPYGPSPECMQDMKLFAEKVIPALKEQRT